MQDGCQPWEWRNDMHTLRRLKKGLAILLTAAMVVGLMPGTGTLQAQAQESQVVKTTIVAQLSRQKSKIFIMN